MLAGWESVWADPAVTYPSQGGLGESVVTCRAGCRKVIGNDDLHLLCERIAAAEVAREGH